MRKWTAQIILVGVRPASKIRANTPDSIHEENRAMLTIRTLGLALSVLLTAVTFAPAAPDAAKKTDKAEKKGKPDYKVTIFDDEHLKGKSVIVRQSVPNLGDLKFNDKSESISWSVAPGKAAVLCDDKNFERPVLLLVGEGSVEDLGKEQRNALHIV